MKSPISNRPSNAGSLLRPAVLSLTFLALVGVGCPGPEVPNNNGNGDGNNASRDGGPGEVVDDELTAVIAAIADGDLDTTFTFDATGTANPGGRVLVYTWEVDAPSGDGCEGNIADPSAASTTFTPGCRGEHTVTVTVAFVDGSVTSKKDATFSVDNRRPELSALAQDADFLPGEDVVISATVTDADGDDTTCTARLASDSAGDPEGLTLPSEPSADCSFTISTPARMDTWKIEVVANDGFEDSAPATIELQSGSLPPVIDGVALDVTETGYSCDQDGCASDPVRVTVTATDDIDAFADLDIDVVDGTVDPVEGVSVTVTDVLGQPGVFDVVVSRADLGPMAGSVTLTARVTEATSEGEPASAEQSASFSVISQAPTVASVTAPDAPHVYDGTNGVFEAELSVAATAGDPEGNRAAALVDLVSCPTAAAGEAGCGGADLTIVETETDGELTLAVSATDLSVLVGTYTFSITAIDVDDLTTTTQEAVLVLNAAPTLSPGFDGAVDQQYASGSHSASFPLVHDAEGDPLSMTLSATCADGTTLAALPGTCASGQNVAISPAGTLTVTGPAPGLLGQYSVSGSVTDGIDSYTVNATVAVENSAPTLARTSAASKTCHHTTSGTTTTNDAACSFPFAGTAEDPNGDPLTYVAVMQPDNDYTLTGTLNGAVPASGALSLTFGVSTTFANFTATFGSQTQQARVQVSDPFGAVAAATTSTRLDNRAPVISAYDFRSRDGTAAPPTFTRQQWDSDREAAVSHDSCRDIGGFWFCTAPAPYRFALDVDAVDPDGDPVQTSLSVTCSDTVVGSDGSAPSALRNLPADGLVPLEMRGHRGDCDALTLFDNYTYWNVNYSPPYSVGTFPNIIFYPARYWASCTMTAASSRVTDGLADTTFASNDSFEVNVQTSEPFSCE